MNNFFLLGLDRKFLIEQNSLTCFLKIIKNLTKNLDSTENFTQGYILFLRAFMLQQQNFNLKN